MGSIYTKMQQKDVPKVDEILVGVRIEYFAVFDMDEDGIERYM